MAVQKSELREYVEALIIAVILAAFIMTFVAKSFVVQGSSMEPSLHHGERLLVDKLTYRFREPERGEVIVFKYPSDQRRMFIKRVIGLPGDEIKVRSAKVFLNDRPLTEDYINGPTYGDFGPVVVPEDHVFVLGDNRNNSDDSRFPDVGFVSRKLIVGRALVSYWPISELGSIYAPQIGGQ